MPSIYRNMEERLLWNSVLDPETGCWIWLGVRGKGGYGRLSVRLPGIKTPRLVYAHRVAYEVFTGRVIPEGFHVDHVCVTPGCINPGHLQAVTIGENMSYRGKR